MNGERRSSRRTLAAVFALVLVFASACVVIASGLTPSVAPANPQFVSYIQSLSSGLPRETTADGHGLGLAPLPVNLPKIKPKAAAMTSMALVGLPATYDLRTTNKLTGVRDQGNCGACWAFAAYGSLESSLRPNETWDFSENNMKNTSGFDLSPCAGGNQLMAAAYLARWSGPVTELDDPYNPNSGESPPTTTVQKHLQEVDFIPDRTGPLDNDTIKRAVMAYGAVYTCLYWGGYYNSNYYAYYYNGTTSVNHAVCIVGWDDGFDRSRFLTAPPGNGAFLCKNSWGLGWGDAGYFWISYYDTKVGTENALFEFAEPTINYDHAYQYDPLGWTHSAGYSAETAWFANIFTAVNEESLNAVSFYTPAPGSGYTIRIYLNPSTGPVDPSGPVATTTGTIADPGYHTVQLDPSVTLQPGDTFSVVVTLNTPGYTYPIPLEAAWAGYSGGATANPGESFISSDGATWSEASTVVANANVCLKAFTADRANLLVSPATNLNASGPTGGPFTPASQIYTLTNIGSDDLGWSAVANQSWVSLSALSGTLAPNESTMVTVSLDPGVAAFDPGAYAGAVQFINETSGIGSTSRTVSLLIKDGYLSVTPATGLSSSGGPGGPFSPSSFSYALTNAGCGQIHWTANKTQQWVTLSIAGGYLQPGERVDVIVSVNATAESLLIGDFSDTIVFSNTTNGDGDTTRNAHLSIVRNYEISQAQFNWIDPSSHSSFILTDDGVTSPRTIPFNFSFYGTTYNQVYVGANGLLGFSSSGLTEYENTDIPNPMAPNATIYPYWDDLDPSAGGSVRIGTQGTAPNRKLVVTWNEIPLYTAWLPVTFQAILCETTGDIIFQYKETQQGDEVYGAGRSATIGIENADGSLAAKYSFNGSSLVQNGQAIQFCTNRNVSIAEAIRMANGVGCTIENAVVTAAPATNLFYIEAEDRSCGISVYKSSHGVTAGNVVNVQGTVSTNTSGERFINATNITPIEGETIIRPLLMSNARIGGDDCHYDPVTNSGQKGIAGAIGVNNIGLYITTTGSVTFRDSTYFYIDDGSNVQDNSTHSGAKVLGMVPVAEGVDPVGKYVIVTGVSSCFKGASPDTNLYRLIRSTQVQVVD